jgi:hypothetical protein
VRFLPVPAPDADGGTAGGGGGAGRAEGAARSGEGKTAKTDDPPAVRLNPTDKRAAKYIRDNPGCKGDAVASEIGVTPEHFRSRVFPKLKRAGFVNDDGYRPPVRKNKAKK